MRNTNKKGFTIVELVIVVAVISILAAVLIPTFSGIIKKANMSADQSAVKQMNTALAIAEVDGVATNLVEAIEDLLEQNIDMDSYKALAKGMSIVWAKDINRVLYVDEDNKVVFPKEYENVTYKMGNWYSLCGEIEENDSWKKNASNGAVTISTGAELASLMNAYVNGDATAVNIKTVTLSADVDLMGTAASFGKVTGGLVIDGAGHTIYGFRNGTYAAARGNSEFGFGLVGQVSSTVVIKNLTIDGAVIDDHSAEDVEAGHAAVVAGKVYSGGNLTLENITVKNCYVNTEKKAGALVGYYAVGKTNLLTLIGDITVSNTTVTGGRQIAALIGYAQQDIVIEEGAEINVENVSVYVNTEYGYVYDENNLTVDSDGDVEAGVTTKHYWYNRIETDFE